jgi:hypothetical protein
MPLHRHESCSRTNGGAQKGAGATQRKGVKGAAALPLRDSGANPVRAQTGGRAQKGGGLACNKGVGAGGDHIPSRSPQRGNKGGPPFVRKRGGAYKTPCVTAVSHSCTSRGGGEKGLPLGGALSLVVPCVL